MLGKNCARALPTLAVHSVRSVTLDSALLQAGIFRVLALQAILPDGTAIPVTDDWLTFGSGGHIPPGSTIVVPRDLQPFNLGDFLKDATQIFSQLAVAAASIAVLHTN